MKLIGIIRSCKPLAELDPDEVRKSGHPATLPKNSFSSVAWHEWPLPRRLIRVRPATRGIKTAKRRVDYAQQRLDAIVVELVELRGLVERNPPSRFMKMSLLRAIRAQQAP